MRWGYVSTSGGLGWFVVKEGRDGVGKNKISCARAFLECPVCDAWYCACNIQNRGGKQNHWRQKKQKEMKGKGRETGEHGERC